MESERNGEKMSKQKREKSLLAFTGATALVVLAVNLAITAFNSHRRKNKKKGFRLRSEIQLVRGFVEFCYLCLCMTLFFLLFC
jgi:hypothetical protein